MNAPITPLPTIEEFTNCRLDDAGYMRLQYRSAGLLYELKLSVADAFLLEEAFIRCRTLLVQRVRSAAPTS